MKTKTIFIKLDNTNNCQHQCPFHDNDGWCVLLHILIDRDRFCFAILEDNKCPLKEHKSISLQIRLKD